MASHPDPPAAGAADVVVIGAGLVGLCAALHLQRSGRRVTLVERGPLAGGASGHNAGIFSLGNCVPTATPDVVRGIPHMLMDPLSPLAIRWSYLPRLAPWLVRFVLASRRARVESASIALAALLDKAVEAYAPLLPAADARVVLRPGGHLIAFRSDSSFARARFGLDLRTRRGVDLALLDSSGIGALDPQLAGRFQRAIHILGAPWVADPRAFTAQLADRFLADGGRLHHAEARDFTVANGTVRAVQTSTGPLPAGAVVVAAGAWSRRLTRRLGVDVPLDTERGYGVDLPDPGLTLRVPVISADFHFALTPAGQGLRLAGTDELAGLSAAPNYSRADRLVEAARVIFPELRTDGATRWMSFRPSLPDALPVIGPVPRYANAYLAFGHGHVGLTLAGITGSVIRELMDGEEPGVDIEPFRPSRFALRRSRDRKRDPGPARTAARRDGRTPH
jgi:D-amino-acid dehydrogenase